VGKRLLTQKKYGSEFVRPQTKYIKKTYLECNSQNGRNEEEGERRDQQGRRTAMTGPATDEDSLPASNLGFESDGNTSMSTRKTSLIDSERMILINEWWVFRILDIFKRSRGIDSFRVTGENEEGTEQEISVNIPFHVDSVEKSEMIIKARSQEIGFNNTSLNKESITTVNGKMGVCNVGERIAAKLIPVERKRGISG